MKATESIGALPTLPPPDRTMWQYGRQIDHYTAEQMQAYALAAMAKFMEEKHGQQD